MEKLKEIFGDRSLTYEQFQAALELDGTVRLADLGSGGYVDRGKLDRLRAELEREREEARRELEELSARYQRDMDAARLRSQVDLALYEAGAKNPRLVRSAIDLSALKPGPGGPEGLREQIEALRESDGYLFGETGPRLVTGARHAAPETDPAELTDAEYYALKSAR